jgi:hypothetical protein
MDRDLGTSLQQHTADIRCPRSYFIIRFNEARDYPFNFSYFLDSLLLNVQFRMNCNYALTEDTHSMTQTVKVSPLY